LIVVTVVIIEATRGSSDNPIQGKLTFKCSATGASTERRVTPSGLNTSGAVDDTAAIQTAIDTAGRDGGGIVSLPSGTLMIDGHLNLQSNVELVGTGPSTILKAGPQFLSSQAPDGGYPIISTLGASNVTVANLTADQSGNSLDAAVPARLTGYVVEGRNSQNVLIEGVYVRNPFSYSIAIVRTDGFCVQHCTTTAATGWKYNQLDGIHILDSSFGSVIYNSVQSGEDGLVAHSIGAPVHSVVYAGNTVHAGKTSAGMQIAIGAFPIYNITVIDNTFYGSLYGIRTGYYAHHTGSLTDTVIKQNYIHDLTLETKMKAIAIGGFGGFGVIDNVTIIGNRTCMAGSVSVQNGPGNSIRDTTACITKLPG
jgi:polygalacturonase